jgi:diacylglycerol kinase (ATP)
VKPLFIVNPQSGGGRTGRTTGALLDVSRKSLGDIDVVATERPRHATELACEAAEAGREVIVAVGGDGSIHEVASGLMLARERGATQASLGIIGQGTGGDFRKALGLEHRLDRYLAAIAGGVSRSIDVGHFAYATHDGREAEGYFVNILSVGMGGLVDTYVAQTTKALGGTLAYFAASARAMLDSQLARLALTVREPAGPGGAAGATREIEVDSRMFAICNGQFFGSGMHVAPTASPFDAKLDVVSIGGASLPSFMRASGRIYGGTHLTQPGVEHFRCDRITVELLGGADPALFCLDVDGEPLGRLPITVRLLPAALPVLLPA